MTVSAKDVPDAAKLMRRALEEGRQVRVHRAGEHGELRPLSDVEFGELLGCVVADAG